MPEDYVHRIGRTARAGAAGVAISLCSDEERGYLRDIEKLTRLAVRQLHVEPDPMKPNRFPLLQERIDSVPARDVRAPGFQDRRPKAARWRQESRRATRWKNYSFISCCFACSAKWSSSKRSCAGVICWPLAMRSPAILSMTCLSPPGSNSAATDLLAIGFGIGGGEAHPLRRPQCPIAGCAGR